LRRTASATNRSGSDQIRPVKTPIQTGSNQGLTWRAVVATLSSV
jgi:hypothetical protein